MPTVVPAPARAASVPNGYLAVQAEMLHRLPRAAVDLYAHEGGDDEPALLVRVGEPINHELLARVVGAGLQRLVVRVSDFERFGAELLEAVEADAATSSVPPAERFAALQLGLAVEIERKAHMLDCGPYVKLSERFGNKLAEVFADAMPWPAELFRLARHDFNLFNHVTNVAGYAVILAERMGLCRGAQLAEVAKGAMLHDIGKRFIPVSILTKPGKLTFQEHAVVELHPQRAYEDLCTRSDVTYEQLMMAYQHHERFDGRGYPVGLKGEEIHPWARMLAVVDVFDALTGVRPHRRPVTADEAMQYIRQNAGSHFDPEAVQCWEMVMSGN